MVVLIEDEVMFVFCLLGRYGEIISYFHEFTVLLLIDKTGDKLPSQSWVVACLSYRELHALKSLGHTFLLWVYKFLNVSTTYLLEFCFMFSLVCLGFS